MSRNIINANCELNALSSEITVNYIRYICYGARGGAVG